MPDPQSLMSGYLDDTLSTEERMTLEEWLLESPQNRKKFTETVLLHDRLRGECLAMSAMTSLPRPVTEKKRAPNRSLIRSAAALFVAVSAMTVVLAILWNGLGGTPASAAVLELNRLIAASARASDRTYRISVDEASLPAGRREFRKPAEVGRPPKPPLDDAVLYVRHGNQFVLVRKTPEGLPFVTGSDGLTSWAVRPDGPVRVSRDLNRFNRDLPGHEQGVPLFQIEEGLEQLRAAYDVQVLRAAGDDDSQSESPPEQLLVALKKRGHRGAQRVEIAYAPETGLIREMRFVKMPYGPERLTIRMTLTDETDLAPDFFQHQSHHGPDRIVKEE